LRSAERVSGHKTFFSNFSWFLFQPFAASEQNLGDPDFIKRKRASYLLVFYIAFVIGVGLWPFIFYPEPLFYSCSAAALKKEIPAIVISNPMISLVTVVIGCFLFIFCYMFIFSGVVNYALFSRLGKGAKPAFNEYLVFFAYSLSPLLFWAPAMAIRLFFFERLVFMRPWYPFFDWTDSNIIYFCAVGVFLAWKYLIELRVNQALFKVSMARALAPLLVQIILLLLLLLAPLLLNDLLFEALRYGLA